MLMVVLLNSRSKVRDISNQKILENMTKRNTQNMRKNYICAKIFEGNNMISWKPKKETVRERNCQAV